MEKTFQDELRELGGRIQPMIENVKTQAQNWGTRLASYVRENPQKALAGAAVAGFVTAMLARRLSR